MSAIVKKKLKIEGMHCSSCAMSIDMDLEDLDGLKDARTSYVRQETAVEFDQDRLDIQKVIASIEKIGYKARIKSD